MKEFDVSIRQDAAMGRDVLERRAMSLEEFDALPREVRAEYVDGVALMSPPSSGGHQDAEVELVIALREALPGLVVRPEVGFQFPWGTRRIADVAVQAVRDDVLWSSEVPLIIVEVHSPSTRNEDLFAKTRDYLRAGVGQYWLVDRQLGTLTVLARADGAWQPVLELDADHPTGEVSLGEHGTISLDLVALLGG